MPAIPDKDRATLEAEAIDARKAELSVSAEIDALQTKVTNLEVELSDTNAALRAKAEELTVAGDKRIAAIEDAVFAFKQELLNVTPDQKVEADVAPQP